MITRDFIMIGDFGPNREAAVSKMVEEVRRRCDDMQCFRVDRIDHLDEDSIHVYVSGMAA